MVVGTQSWTKHPHGEDCRCRGRPGKDRESRRGDIPATEKHDQFRVLHWTAFLHPQWCLCRAFLARTQHALCGAAMLESLEILGRSQGLVLAQLDSNRRRMPLTALHTGYAAGHHNLLAVAAPTVVVPWHPQAGEKCMGRPPSGSRLLVIDFGQGSAS